MLYVARDGAGLSQLSVITRLPPRNYGHTLSPDNAMSTDRGIADAMIEKGYDLEKLMRPSRNCHPA